MTDTFSRVMMNVGAPFQQLQPHASIMMRYIMIMVYNAYLLSRAFAIGHRLTAAPTAKGAILSLDLLHHALKNEGSFMNSIATLSREGFKFSGDLFEVTAHPSAAEGAVLMEPLYSTLGQAAPVGGLLNTQETARESPGSALREQREASKDCI